MHTGKLHGKGTLVYADGPMVECEFEHGKYIVPSSHHIDDTIHDKQPQQNDHDDHDVNTTTIDATKLQQENPQQQQLPSSSAVLTAKQSRRVKKSREVETAGYTPLNLSLLNGSDNNNNIELGRNRRDRVILKPHQYS